MERACQAEETACKGLDMRRSGKAPEEMVREETPGEHGEAGWGWPGSPGPPRRPRGGSEPCWGSSAGTTGGSGNHHLPHFSVPGPELLVPLDQAVHLKPCSQASSFGKTRRWPHEICTCGHLTVMLRVRLSTTGRPLGSYGE